MAAAIVTAGGVASPAFDPGRGGSGGGVRGATDATRDGTADSGDTMAPETGVAGSGGGGCVGVSASAAENTEAMELTDAGAMGPIAELGVTGPLPAITA